MMIEVKVPSVGESVTSGVVSAWHKKSGEFVNEGEPLFALETDKVSTDIVAQKSGVLETRVREGQEVKIGEVVAVIDDSKQRAPEEKAEEHPDQRKEPKRTKKETEAKEKPQPGRASADGRSESTTPAGGLSPAVRRIVEEENLDPQKISATGQGGRLTKGDALKAAEARGKADQKSETPEHQSQADLSAAALGAPEHQEGGSGKSEARFTRKKMSPLRRKIAQQLVMAQHTSAILTTF